MLFNLEDEQNIDLRHRLLLSELPTHRLVRMSCCDMANSPIFRQRKKSTKKHTHEVMRNDRKLGGIGSGLLEYHNCGRLRMRYH